MSENQSMFVFMVGLLITMGAVGGIELSVTALELLGSLALSLLGMATMYCGVLGLRNSKYY